MANIKGKVKTLAMVKNVVNVKNCTIAILLNNAISLQE